MKSTYLNPNGKWFKMPLALRATYNCHDTFETARLVPRLRETLARNGQLEFYDRWHRETVPVALAMMRRGIGDLDIEAREAYKRTLAAELDPLEAKILAYAEPYFDGLESRAAEELHEWIASGPINKDGTPRRLSGAQKHAESQSRKLAKRRKTFFNNGGPGVGDLARWMFTTLGFAPAPKTHTRPAYSVSQDALTYILGHMRQRDLPHRWVLEDLFHRSRLNTILSRYMVIDCDAEGRVRPTIRLYSAETLRWAYAGDEGEAIHQWPKEARHVIRAKPGHTYIAADHGQLEARIQAVLADDTPSLEAFARGEDIHKVNSLDLFGLSESQWEATPPDRQTQTRNYSKSFLYKLSYGGKSDSDSQKLYCPCPRCVHKVPQVIDLTRAQKVAAEERWYARHPRVKSFRRNLLNSIKGPGADHSWTSPFGYKRFFLEPASEAERSIYNFPMQHCASEIVRRSMVRLHGMGAPLAIQMHDEIVLESPDHLVDHWSAVLKTVMEMPVPELGGAVFPVKVGVGKDWGAVSK